MTELEAAQILRAQHAARQRIHEHCSIGLACRLLGVKHDLVREELRRMVRASEAAVNFELALVQEFDSIIAALAVAKEAP